MEVDYRRVILGTTIESLPKELCTGCSSCYNKCIHNSIEMVKDKKGFLYPEINHTKCIECGICSKACPIISHEKETTNQVYVVYSAWSNDTDTRLNSTSGGVFFEIAKYVLELDGVVVGAKYNNDFSVSHCCISDIKMLKLLMQSKYVQSEMGDTFQSVEKALHNGKTVLFAGTPCQCAGLKKYLGRKHEKLILCDFICRGVNAPAAYQAYLNELKEKYGSEIKKVWFKNKTYGWNHFGTKIVFCDGQEYFRNRDEDDFMYGFIKKNLNLYIRDCCEQCKFKEHNSEADITLGDFWGLNTDDDYGISAVIIRSDKGAKIFDQLGSIVKQVRDISDIKKGNVCFENSIKQSEKSIDFWKHLSEGDSFSVAIQKIKDSINKL